jgi:hypothetical protein
MTERAQAWRNALYGGIFFGLIYGLITSFLNGWLPPGSPGQAAAILAQIILGGGIFAVVIGLFASSRIVPSAADIALEPGDGVEHSGFANHFLNFEGRGGRLALTKTELVFKPHVVNVQRGELRIPRAEIASATAVRTFGVVPNGLAVKLKSGKVETFVVNNRNDWVARLDGSRLAGGGSPEVR